MRRIVVFGNSGSGKSTLAKQLAASEPLCHLDLDTLAWQPVQPPQRQPLAQSQAEIERFIASHDAWVIEGCYSDLLQSAVPHCNQMYYLNLPVADCIANARQRPWEPHKYPSKAAQDANLTMLIEWIMAYENRDDTFSATAHQALYREFSGPKTMIRENQRHS